MIKFVLYGLAYFVSSLSFWKFFQLAVLELFVNRLCIVVCRPIYIHRIGIKNCLTMHI